MIEHAPMIGEPLAVDLVNTRPQGTDLLADPEMLAAWLVLQADRIPEPAAAVKPTASDLAAVLAVREHTAAAFGALLNGKRPPQTALDGLNAAQAAAPAVRHLDWEGDSVTSAVQRTGTSAAILAAILAESAANVLADPAIAKLKRCEADDCAMVFLPAHPRRRWCSPERCGNRARVARYYQRHKS
jgi:predicted RNA-binding Zn ribbon-like protein